ncbi:hypothetical protein Trydic_g90 [Trypoxylus dichotomus]
MSSSNATSPVSYYISQFIVHSALLPLLNRPLSYATAERCVGETAAAAAYRAAFVWAMAAAAVVLPANRPRPGPNDDELNFPERTNRNKWQKER